MKAEIKKFYSPDINDLKTFFPDRLDEFGFLLQIAVGPKDMIGEENFDVMVCTPKWLLQNHNESDVIFGRNYLIMFEYSFERLFEKFEKYISALNEDSWEELAIKISRIGKWEFEDYRY